MSYIYIVYLNIISGVSRISFRGGGGGVQNIFGKVEAFAWREAREFGGMFAEKIFKNGAIWCILENIL